MRLEDILEVAKTEARKSVVRIQHGAVLVKGGKQGEIIATGFNKHVFHCRGKHISIHAEVDAISNCNPRDLPDCVLFVVRLGPLGDLKNSKPCNHCQSYIRRKGIKLVFYSDASLTNS